MLLQFFQQGYFLKAERLAGEALDAVALIGSFEMLFAGAGAHLQRRLAGVLLPFGRTRVSRTVLLKKIKHAVGIQSKGRAALEQLLDVEALFDPFGLA